MLVSPTERPPISELGESSSRPEKYGVDVMFLANGAVVGVQRKAIADLVASARDGRLGKERRLAAKLGRKPPEVSGGNRSGADQTP